MESRKQANRHKDYVNDGEDAEMLVDRAVQLKINVQKKEQIEESLVTNFSNLTMLLELLNMEGDNTQGVKLSNKVTVVIEKYRGKIETFQHKDRSTLKFAITKRQDNSSKSSKNSSRNNSIDRRYSRIHDHLKPNKVSWEESLEVVLKFQEEFQIWIIEVPRVSGSDKEFVWNSLMALLDAEWTKRKTRL